MSFLGWLADSAPGIAVRETLWMYPVMLTLHAVGMAIVVGLLLMVNLRVLGFAKAIPLASMKGVNSVVVSGFAVNFLSGAMLFVGDAPRYATSAPFLIKMLCIVIGGVLAWVLARMLAATPPDRSGATSGHARALAALSTVVWLVAITAGRLTAYL
jgi:hypothetical protein